MYRHRSDVSYCESLGELFSSKFNNARKKFSLRFSMEAKVSKPFLEGKTEMAKSFFSLGSADKDDKN
jgi:hypothetical protein